MVLERFLACKSEACQIESSFFAPLRLGLTKVLSESDKTAEPSIKYVMPEAARFIKAGARGAGSRFHNWAEDGVQRTQPVPEPHGLVLDREAGFAPTFPYLGLDGGKLEVYNHWKQIRQSVKSIVMTRTKGWPI